MKQGRENQEGDRFEISLTWEKSGGYIFQGFGGYSSNERINSIRQVIPHQYLDDTLGSSHKWPRCDMMSP